MSFPLLASTQSVGKTGQNNASIQEFAWNDLSDNEVIGSGSFGSVITAKYHGKSAVVKKLLIFRDDFERVFVFWVFVLYPPSKLLNMRVN